MGHLPARALSGQAKKLIALARARYERDDVEALSELGFTEEDLAPEEVAAFPENAEVAELFLTLDTQWRAGLNGATGLDYGAIRATARMLGIKVGRGRFLELRMMEIEALNAMAEARENATARRR